MRVISNVHAGRRFPTPGIEHVIGFGAQKKHELRPAVRPFLFTPFAIVDGTTVSGTRLRAFVDVIRAVAMWLVF